MEAPQLDGSFSSNGSREKALQQLAQQAGAVTSLAQAQALLSQLLTQQHALLQENQQLHAAQQALAASEARLHAAEAVAGMGSYELELATGNLHFSDGMCRLFGEAPRSFTPSVNWIDDRSNPDDALAIRQIIEQTVQTSQPYHYTRRIRRADGQWRTLESHGRVVGDATGQPSRLEGVVEDKTDQRQAEQALRRSEEQFRLFVTASSDLVYKMSADWRQKYHLNGPEFLADPTTAPSTWLQTYIPAEDQPEVEHVIAQAIEAKHLFELEHRVRRADGTVGWVYARAVPVLDTHGDIVEWVGAERDITPRKEAEQELRTAKARLQATLDSSLATIQAFEAVRDEQGQIRDFVWVFTNQAWVNLHGERVGQRLLAQNPDVVESGLFAQFVQVTETGIPIDQEQHYCHEQVEGWFHQTLVKMGDGFVLNTEDITGRKQAEQQVVTLKDALAQRAQDRYHALFHAIDEGFGLFEVLYDEQGTAVDYRVQEVNQVFERQTGLAAATGKLGSELASHSEASWLNTYAQVVRTGQPMRFENYHHATGTWYDAYVSRVGGVGNRQVCVVFNDITERKQAEVQLRESGERLQQALSIDTVGVLFFDLAGRIHGANEAFARMSGYTQADLASGYVSLEQVTAPEFRDVTRHSLEELRQEGKSTPYEKQYLQADGSRRWGLFAGKRLSAHEGVKFVLDITNRKQAEEELQAVNKQLMRTNVDLDNFIYTASHDLKQPIANIEGLLLALQHELPAAALVGEVPTMLHLMQEAVERFGRTIMHLTDVSRLQQAHAQPATHVNLAQVVQEVQLDLAPLIAQTAAQVLVAVPDNTTLLFSAKNLRSVVYNLLSNALKYHHPDRLLVVHLTYQLEAEVQVLEVADNGLGLDLAHGQDKLFAMFQRLHTHVEGTGIGLYMVKKMVENVGGRIEVQSVLGEGSTFRVYFPR
jgi:PAS domain S-box-containing protein